MYRTWTFCLLRLYFLQETSCFAIPQIPHVPYSIRDFITSRAHRLCFLHKTRREGETESQTSQRFPYFLVGPCDPWKMALFSFPPSFTSRCFHSRPAGGCWLHHVEERIMLSSVLLSCSRSHLAFNGLGWFISALHCVMFEIRIYFLAVLSPSTLNQIFFP